MTPSRTIVRYRQLIERFKRVRVVVAGDLIADEFIYGRVERVSREAPVLILRYDATEIVPGGAGNAAANAAALGAAVEVIGVVGHDDAGRRLLEALKSGVSTQSVLRARNYVTPIKTRILAGGAHSAKQQVVRIDRSGGSIEASSARYAGRALAGAVSRADAVIISDYGSELITPTILRSARDAARSRMPLVLVDSRYALAKFTGMTACTPNESEVEVMLGLRIGDDPEALETAGRRLVQQLQASAVLITRGSRGMALFVPDNPTELIPIVGSDEIADVTGAGDPVIATFTLALAAGASFSEAAHLANHAAGLVVMKRGTATVSAQELLAAVGGA